MAFLQLAVPSFVGTLFQSEWAYELAQVSLKEDPLFLSQESWERESKAPDPRCGRTHAVTRVWRKGSVQSPTQRRAGASFSKGWSGEVNQRRVFSSAFCPWQWPLFLRFQSPGLVWQSDPLLQTAQALWCMVSILYWWSKRQLIK